MNMINYSKEIIERYLELITGTTASLTAKNLFIVQEDVNLLNKKRDHKFQNYIVKLLWISKCAWPDIQNSLVFLTTRVKHTDEDDKKNIIFLWNLNRKLHMGLTIKSDGKSILK